MSETSKNYLYLGVLIVVAILVLVLLWWWNQKATPEAPHFAPKEHNEQKASASVEELVAGIDETHLASYNNAERLVEKGPEIIPELLEIIQRDDWHAKWAALYALSRLGYDRDDETRQNIIDTIKPELENDNASLRTMAAGIVTIFGDREGIPVLIAELDNQDLLMLSEPPLPICQYAYDTLTYYTKQNFGTACEDSETDSKAKQGFNAWYDQNQAKLTWNNNVKSYESQ